MPSCTVTWSRGCINTTTKVLISSFLVTMSRSIGGFLLALCLVLAANIVQVRGGLQNELPEILSSLNNEDPEEDFCDDDGTQESHKECKGANVYKSGKKETQCFDCHVNAICTQKKNKKYKCDCKEGFFGNGYVCYDTLCYSFPCMNGGLCVPHKSTFRCHCLAGFRGHRCEKRVYPCRFEEPETDETRKNDCEWTNKTDRDYCQNDGKLICTKDNNGTCKTECECLSAFTGKRCDTVNVTKKHCHKSGGEIKNDICQCYDQYTGVFCQERKYQNYMHFPRVHFAGWWQADVPTVNNDIQNFDIQNFNADNAKLNGKGSWNPTGSGNFRIFDAHVTRVCAIHGNCDDNRDEGDRDAMIGAAVKDGDLKSFAKMVDIDVEAEGDATELWGLVVHVDGFFKGDFQLASCRYLWNKMKDVSGITGRATKYQSVLTNVVFGPKTDTSNVAKQLKNSLGKKRELSISFNIDMFDKYSGTDNYTYGRIVGSIGLSGRESPPYFTYGRYLKPCVGVKIASYAPVTGPVDGKDKNIYIDLGNSLAIDKNGNILDSVGQLTIGWLKSKHKHPSCSQSSDIKWINEVKYKDHGGYLFTSGIIVVPIPPEINADEFKENQLILAKTDSNRKCVEILLAEEESGIDVQPYSRWVFRIPFQEKRNMIFWVMEFGKKINDKNDIQSLQLHIKESSSILNLERSREPELGFPVQTKFTKGDHQINITITAKNDPANIRKYKDGQVYALEYYINEPDFPLDWMTALNTGILVLVWNQFEAPEDPTWITHIRPIFQQYANLYPVMKINFMDLGNYFDVVKHKERILQTMTLPISDPNFMPVTRDLSPNKMEMIINWLKSAHLPFGSKKTPITVDTLKYLLQTALQLEHATIPPYLSGYLSIKDGRNQEVKEILRKVLIDEMYHLAQVSNILNAVGGNPDLLRPDFIIPYPSYLPGGAHPHVLITVDKVSLRQVEDVYMEIEKPFHELEEHGIEKLIEVILSNLTGAFQNASNETNCEDEKKKLFQDYKNAITNHNTIGELYTVIIWVLLDLTECGENNSIFTKPGTTSKQLQRIGPNESFPLEITNLKSAIEGIQIITHQGEGATPCNPSQVSDNWKEISHYYQFASIIHKHYVKDTTDASNGEQPNPQKAQCKGDFAYIGKDLPFHQGGVWPIVKDPQMSKYKPGSKAYVLSKQFNEVYSRLLHTLQNVFNGNVEKFDDSMGLMKTLMVIGNRLVQTPIEEGGDPNIGPNAGPTYRNDY